MNKIKTRAELEKLNMQITQWLYHNNRKLLNECLPVSKNKWTLSSLKKEARKYKYRVDWIRANVSSYNAASKKGCLEECTRHMILKQKKCIINLDTGKVFQSGTEAAKFYQVLNSHISSVASGKRKSAGGYRWAYCDKDGNILDKSSAK